jgi:uncharacterized protein YecE (DUF72 family)
VATLRIGISGWRYAPWRGVFYPKDLPQRAELEYASRQVGSIELNGSFYSLQRPASYAGWNEATPRGFVFAVKGPRFITHIKRLRDFDGPLANFLASGLFELGAKLGPILWQCPPNQRFDEALFDHFLGALPRDTQQAAALARRHDHRLKHGASVAPDRKRRLRHALEIRHESFICEAFIALLRRHKVALVVADTAGRWPYLEDVTADFMYLRLHGDEKLYTSGYGDAALERWAARIREWARGGEPEDAVRASTRPPPRRASRDVYCYFDNDAKVHAPFDAQSLMRKLGL